jgi:hypothetical protein
MNLANQKIEGLLRQASENFVYPPTPDLSSRLSAEAKNRARPRRSLTTALTVLLLVLATSLLAVPGVRAQLAEWLQIGAVRILRGDPSATATVAQDQEGHLLSGPTTRTPSPAFVITSVLDLDGETSLRAARATVSFPIPLPAYPQYLGEPDHVFLQGSGDGQFVVLVWLQENQAAQAELVLYVIGEAVQLNKGVPEVIEAVEVLGELAILTRGAHLLTTEGSEQYAKLVNAPTLIWVQDGITYRLEADLPLDEMIRIAESLALQ